MPPASAPTVVATSRTIPRRMLVMPRAAKVLWAMEDVAITQMMLVAIAVLMGTPKARLRTGTMMMPPPTPSMLPNTPATKATSRIPMTTAMGGTLQSPRPADSSGTAADRRRRSSSPEGGRRRRLAAARRDFCARRRSLAAREGRVGRRGGGGGSLSRRSLSRRRRSASILLRYWLRCARLVTVRPVARCTRRTALSVTFWCCPPGPPARNVCTSHSASRASSLSGMSMGPVTACLRGAGRRPSKRITAP